MALPLPRPFLFHRQRNTHSLRLDQQEVYAQEDEDHGWDHAHMEDEEPRQRSLGHIRAAAKQDQRHVAHYRHQAHHPGPHLRGGDREDVPWEQVSGEPGRQPAREQGASGNPGELSRLAVGSKQPLERQMDKCESDKQMG